MCKIGVLIKLIDFPRLTRSTDVPMANKIYTEPVWLSEARERGTLKEGEERENNRVNWIRSSGTLQDNQEQRENAITKEMKRNVA